MLASAASPGHRLREQWVQVIGGLASACGRLKSTYGGPRSAVEQPPSSLPNLAAAAVAARVAGYVLPPQHLLLDSSTASAGPRELAACKTLARKQANFAGPARYEIATIPPTNRALTSQYCCETGREL